MPETGDSVTRKSGHQQGCVQATGKVTVGYYGDEDGGPIRCDECGGWLTAAGGPA